MEFKAFNGNSLFPALGLGTWGMGGWQQRSEVNDDREVEAIRAALKSGLIHIDTAEMYGQGHAEELVREASTGIRRKELFLTSKKWADNLNYDAILASCKNSLRRLGTHYLDLYLIHFYNPVYSMSKTLAAMDHLVDKGLVRNIGVSNFNLAQLKRAKRQVRHPIVANQVHFNLLDREQGEELLPYCREEGILLIAYQPLKRGVLAGTGPDHHLLDEMVEKYHKSHAQIALRWLLDQDGVVTIPKMTHPSHLEDNLGALGWHLDHDDWLALANACIPQRLF